VRAVIACVDYGDHLAQTLPAWMPILAGWSVTVVTSAADTETQAIGKACGARVLITDAWQRHDPTFVPPAHWHAYWRERGRVDATGKVDLTPRFNKALAMDEAIGLAGDKTPRPLRGELVLAIDADGYPRGALPHPDTFKAETIYGCRRYDGLPRFQRGREIVMKGRIAVSQHRACTSVGGGYFQLFRWDGRERFGSYPGADGYDYDLAMRFPRGALIDSLEVLHYGETHKNWWGRVTPRLTTETAR